MQQQDKFQQRILDMVQKQNNMIEKLYKKVSEQQDKDKLSFIWILIK